MLTIYILNISVFALYLHMGNELKGNAHLHDKSLVDILFGYILLKVGWLQEPQEELIDQLQERGANKSLKQ